MFLGCQLYYKAHKWDLLALWIHPCALHPLNYYFGKPTIFTSLARSYCYVSNQKSRGLFKPYSKFTIFNATVLLKKLLIMYYIFCTFQIWIIIKMEMEYLIKEPKSLSIQLFLIYTNWTTEFYNDDHISYYITKKKEG